MAKQETSALNRILVAVCRDSVRLFRNHAGAGHVSQSPVKGSRYQTFGLHPGSADLIGWTSIVVTPEMAGRKIAVFTSIEVKTKLGVPSAAQKRWERAVMDAGGFAGIARTPEEAAAICGMTRTK